MKGKITREELDQSLVTDIKNINLQLDIITNKIEINLLDYGCKVDDETFDNSPILQQALDYIENNGRGGTIILPTGTIYFKETVNIPECVKIKGSGSAFTETDRSTYTILKFIPSSSKTFIKLKPFRRYYHFGFHLENLLILCENKLGDEGINLITASECNIKDVKVQGFNINVICGYNMFLNIDNLNCTRFKDYGLLMMLHENGVSTTTRINHSYFGQSLKSVDEHFANSCPMRIYSKSVTDLTLNNCTIESCENGFKFGYGNQITIINGYSENIPASNKGAIFNIGQLYGQAAPPNNSFRGITNIISGRFLGSTINNAIDEGYSIFNLEEGAMLNVDGTTFINNNNFVNSNNNFKNITLKNISCYGILKDFTTYKQNNILLLNCLGGDNNVYNKQNKLYLNYEDVGYILECAYGYSKGEIVFRNISDNTLVLNLDANSNINHHYSGYCNGAKKVNILGIQSPSFGTQENDCIYYWATTKGDDTTLMVRTKKNKEYDLLPCICSSNERPTNPYMGQMVYDTDLKCPIWYDAYNAQWKKADNTIV